MFLDPNALTLSILSSDQESVSFLYIQRFECSPFYKKMSKEATRCVVCLVQSYEHVRKVPIYLIALEHLPFF